MTVKPAPRCIECGKHMARASVDSIRCRRCYLKHPWRFKASPRAPQAIVEPFGLIAIPEGVTVTYVRKGAA